MPAITDKETVAVTQADHPDTIPFWRRKRLEDMTLPEWESLCDHCGRCCLPTLTEDDTNKYYITDLACKLLDTSNCQCTDYENRNVRVPACNKFTPAVVDTLFIMPASCAYRTLREGRDLAWWHPLVSGDKNTVRSAGISVTGRVVPEQKAGRREYHIVDWPTQPVPCQPKDLWTAAMFGGINASVPTPFAADGSPALDLMAQHCFWLLSSGCNGLAVMDKAGEVASLTMAERHAILEGLVSRGVPASKIMCGLGAASAMETRQLVDRADELGVRGVLILASAPGLVTPRDIISPAVTDRLSVVPEHMHVYLSLPVPASAIPATLTALEAFMTAAPKRLRGIRDETAGCQVGLAAKQRFPDPWFEVYTADETMLGSLTASGGSGLIGGGANMLARLCAGLLRGAEADQTARIGQIIKATCQILRAASTVPATKALIARHTRSPDWNRVRLPLRSLGPEKQISLFQSFDALGVALLPPV